MKKLIDNTTKFKKKYSKLNWTPNSTATYIYTKYLCILCHLFSQYSLERMLQQITAILIVMLTIGTSTVYGQRCSHLFCRSDTTQLCCSLRRLNSTTFRVRRSGSSTTCCGTNWCCSLNYPVCCGTGEYCPTNYPVCCGGGTCCRQGRFCCTIGGRRACCSVSRAYSNTNVDDDTVDA